MNADESAAKRQRIASDAGTMPRMPQHAEMTRSPALNSTQVVTSVNYAEKDSGDDDNDDDNSNDDDDDNDNGDDDGTPSNDASDDVNEPVLPVDPEEEAQM